VSEDHLFARVRAVQNILEAGAIRLFHDAEELILTEEQRIDRVITEALNNLANAIQNMIAERSSDRDALAKAQADLAQASSDRDAAQAQVASLQGQLADAETQVNALIAQIA
jgi:septal ring factor EnvC (AmiA/AmiB activator)